MAKQINNIFKEEKMKKQILSGLFMALALSMASPLSAAAAGFASIDTGIKENVAATGQYSNWDGVPTVSQFLDENNQPAFAFKSGKKIQVVKTSGGKVTKKISLTMKGSLFGAAACDAKGNLYVVSGKNNTGSDTNANTVFITKYNKNGKLLKSVGNNGSSSLADYYDDSFNTKKPFSSGSCDIAVNENYLAVDYGREMYSGHQSNSVWMLDTNTMTTVQPNTGDPYGYSNYQSHSFGQRAIPYEGGFAFMGEGDCFDRCFTFSTAELKMGGASSQPVFDFWVEKGTYNKYDMYTLNNNFAHIGNICDLGNGTISFVASSVQAMDSNAKKQNEQVFIQIFDPAKDLTSKNAYVTTGERSGTAGNNGDEKKTNHGVKWLTNYASGSIANPQAVSDAKGNTIVLYERYGANKAFQGVYMMKVSSKGKIVKKASCISKTATLNSCETPLYANGYVYWCGNNYGDYANHKLYVYKTKG